MGSKLIYFQQKGCPSHNFNIYCGKTINCSQKEKTNDKLSNVHLLSIWKHILNISKLLIRWYEMVQFEVGDPIVVSISLFQIMYDDHHVSFNTLEKNLKFLPWNAHMACQIKEIKLNGPHSHRYRLMRSRQHAKHTFEKKKEKNDSSNSPKSQ